MVTDLLHDPHYPTFDPPVPATERILRLFFVLVERKGGTVEVAKHYRQLCEQSGLRLVAQRGVFLVAQDPRDYLTYFRDVILTIRENLLTEQLATPGEINGLVQELDAAQATVQFGV